MEEVKYVTIVGENSLKPSVDNLNFVLATNDSEIDLKVDEYKNDYLSGELEVTDEAIRTITQKFSNLDSIISSRVSELEEEIKKLDMDIVKLENSSKGLKGKEKQEALTKITTLDTRAAELKNKLAEHLATYSNEEVGSYPYFDVDKLDFNNTDYLFYKPIMYRDPNMGTYIHAVVILELSTKSLIDNVDREMTRILMLGLIIAAIAVTAGIVGSYLFASLIVRPIKKLEAHVTMIGETKNKINLKGKDVVIKSKDEVGRLGDAINVMTRELVTNAEVRKLSEQLYRPLQALLLQHW